MTFSLSGTTVTQSGSGASTDTDISAASTLEGVTTQGDRFKIVAFSGRTLSVSGDLSIDTESYTAVFTGSDSLRNIVRVANGGVLTIGARKTVNSVVRGSQGLVAIEKNNVHCCSNGSLTVDNGGTLNLYSTLIVRSVVMFDSLSNVTVRDGAIICLESGMLVRARCQGPNIDVDGLLTVGISLDLFDSRVTLNNWTVRQSQRAFELVGNASDVNKQMWVFEGLVTDGLEYTGDLWDGSSAKFYGLSQELDFIYGGVSQGRSAVLVYSRLQVSTTDAAGAAFSGAKWYVADTDHGGHTNINTLDGVDYALGEAKTYSGTTDSSGNGVVTDILTAVYRQDSSITRNYNGHDYKGGQLDRRGNTNDANYEFTIYIWAYGMLPATRTVNMIGKDTVNPVVLLNADVKVTEPLKATVDAYTQIDTPQKVYDRALSWKLDNISTLSPSISAMPLSREGNTITSSYSVMVDRTATDVFSFSGNTITIKADTFTGNFAVSGSALVGTANGAIIVGGIIDATGDSYLAFSGIDSWVVYSDAAYSTELGRGSGSETYRFIYASGVTYYTSLTVSGETIDKPVAIGSAGETTVSLGANSLLATVISGIDSLKPLIQSAAPSAAQNAAAVWTAGVDASDASVTASQVVLDARDQARLAAGLGAAPSAAQNAAAVWTAGVDASDASVTASQVVLDARDQARLAAGLGAAPSAAQNAAAVWTAGVDASDASVTASQVVLDARDQARLAAGLSAASV